MYVYRHEDWKIYLHGPGTPKKQHADITQDCRVTDGVFNVVWIYATFDTMNATTKVIDNRNSSVNVFVLTYWEY